VTSCRYTVGSVLTSLALRGDRAFGYPCRVKSFRKAVSVVMDDLELYYSIIEQLAPAVSIRINLCSKLAQLQQ
jgi:hypothetical protein